MKRLALAATLVFYASLPAFSADAASPRARAMAAGTVLPVELTAPLCSANLRPGAVFEARLTENLYFLGKGLVLPSGTRFSGRVIEAVPSGRMIGKARLSLTLEALQIPGRPPATIKTDERRYREENLFWSRVTSVLHGAMTGALFASVLGSGGAGAGYGAAAAGTLSANQTLFQHDIYLERGARLFFTILNDVPLP